MTFLNSFTMVNLQNKVRKGVAKSIIVRMLTGKDEEGNPVPSDDRGRRTIGK
jgi:hypothetical protein